MLLRRACALMIAVLLSGCSVLSWDPTSIFDEGSDTPVTVPPEPAVGTSSEPASQAPSDSPDQFCIGLGKSDAQIAAQNGTDAATQRKIADESYSQCMAKSGHDLN